MGIKNIDGTLLRKMMIGSCNKLGENKELLNALNVFPVPDGDTGSNMYLTVLAAVREIEHLNSPNIFEVARAASNGALRGARGNSGVILSQLFRGIVKALDGKDIANISDIAKSFSKCSEAAYKAVMKPKEGTILTISRCVAEKAMELSLESDDISYLFTESIKFGNEVLETTTEMLPALKQANVVDSGGKGLMCILEGAFEALLFDGEIFIKDTFENENTENDKFAHVLTEDIKFAYCTEFFINVKKIDKNIEDNLKSFLSSVGDSIALVVDDGIIKLHIHTNNPGKVLEKAVTIGELSNLKIENMKIQHSNYINFTNNTSESLEMEKISIGFVAVAMGSGVATTLKELGVHKVIEGGQTMNPSIDDIVKAIESVNADNVVVFPNNKNIILAAQQAINIVKDKNVFVIETINFPQCITSMINVSGFDITAKSISNSDVESIINLMKENMHNVKTGEVTFAVRNTTIDDVEIVEGDILCMLENKINNISHSIEEGSKILISALLEDYSGFICIYYGQDILKEEAEKLSLYVEENFPDAEVEVRFGGQPLYYYVISAE